MTAHEYVEDRILKQLEELEPVQAKYAQVASYFPMVLTAFSTFVAVLPKLHQQYWIPMVLALVATLEAYALFRQWALLNTQTAATVQELTEILDWWQSRTLMQQRLPSFTEDLVDEVESAIMGRIAALTALRSS